MNENTFTCYLCKSQFPLGDSEEAEKEFVREFGENIADDDRVICCDDCYNRVMNNGLRDHLKQNAAPNN